jgi:hypothetical protein
MTRGEETTWWYLLGLVMGLGFSPFSDTVWWKIGGFVLLAWAILRRETK